MRNEQLRLYQVDAFTSQQFGGNPAAIILLEAWLDDPIMQSIAEENNLSETAFMCKTSMGHYELRWFTPVYEVDLCGHATLAAGYIVLNKLEPTLAQVSFATRSGELLVSKNDIDLSMQLPRLTVVKTEIMPALQDALGIPIHEVFQGDDIMVITDSEQTIKEIKPDFNLLTTIKTRGVCVTAKGNEVDFVSRFFAPAAGINEDPVTGSAHCMLTPYWSKQLGKNTLHARQLSSRIGELRCTLHDQQVELQGQVVPYMEAVIDI